MRFILSIFSLFFILMMIQYSGSTADLRNLCNARGIMVPSRCTKKGLRGLLEQADLIANNRPKSPDNVSVVSNDSNKSDGSRRSNHSNSSNDHVSVASAGSRRSNRMSTEDRALEIKRLELEERRLETEQRRINADLERQRLEAEQQARDHEFRMQQLAQGNSPEAPVIIRPRNNSVDITRLYSKFSEKGDLTIERFLSGFENVCRAHEIPETTWGKYLPSLLTGQALQIFTTLRAEEATNYEILKQRLLSAYKLSSEELRRRFRSLKKSPSETHTYFVQRLDESFRHWTHSTEINSFEGLYDLMVLEQFYSQLPTNLVSWLSDRKPKTFSEAAKLADEYCACRQSHTPEIFTQSPTKSKYPSFKKSSTSFVNSSTVKRSEPSNHKPELKSDPGTTRTVLSCTYCGKTRHTRNTCYKRISDEAKSSGPTKVVARIHTPSGLLKRNFFQLEVNGKLITALYDTGCSLSLVHQSLIKPEDLTGRCQLAKQPLDAYVQEVPLAKVNLNFGQTNRVVEVGVTPNLDGISMLFGDDLSEELKLDAPRDINRVITRAQSRKDELQRQFQPPISSATPHLDPLIVSSPDISNDNSEASSSGDSPVSSVSSSVYIPTVPITVGDLEGINTENFIRLQKEDESLKPLFEQAVSGEKKRGSAFIIEGSLLYRIGITNRPTSKQLVVPITLRPKVLALAHDAKLAGHVGVTRVILKITPLFYWPNLYSDVRDYVTSCEICQKVSKQPTPPAHPLVRVPVVAEPFSRVVFDIIGPFNETRAGNKFVLVVVDFATRYPEAIPLPNIRAETVADALISIFTRVGFSKEVQHDKALNFCNQLMDCLWKHTGVKEIKSSAYHPATNSVVERMNRTLKEALKALAADYKEDWDSLLPYILFAVREVPCRSTGFSPFELLYGRQVRGPLTLLREMWDGTLPEEDSPNAVSYVLQMRDRLTELRDLAVDKLEESQTEQKTWFDKKARTREFKPGDKVLVLLPTKKSRLLCSWTGPAVVVKRLNAVDYVIDMCNQKRDHRVYHVNILKKFVERPARLVCYVNMCDVGEPSFPEITSTSDVDKKVLTNTISSSEITEEQQNQLLDLVSKFPNLFSSKPGHTSIVEHHIRLKDEEPVSQPAYRCSPRVKEIIRKELETLKEQDLIYESDSPYVSPMIIVEREGKSPRACVDYRKLNDKTISDGYPMKHLDDCVERLSKARYISTVDGTKGYFQISIAPSSRKYAAFSTPFGQYEYRRMSFGLKCAPATYQRCIDKVLAGTEDYCGAYLDDIAIFSDTWEEHLIHLRDVFIRLSKEGMTLRPDKCQWGRGQVEYLGFLVGSGTRQPNASKTAVLLSYPAPKTKKQVRAYLGLTGYYGKHISNYAELAAPLTDLLRKKQPDPVKWNEETEKAFSQLNTALTSNPILTAPDYSKPFSISCDASQRAIGSVLTQVGSDGMDHPIAFSSRKLTPTEQRYSTIEQELLALLHAVNRYHHYIAGSHFTVITDHNPLRYLFKMANQNSRLMRWSIYLSQYSFDIRHQKGKENVVADYLSRMETE